jgi:K+-transporting ATPase ATPase C chain
MKLTLTLLQSLRMLAVLTLLTGALYPFTVTGLGALLFPKQANGSLVVRDGRIIGSSLLAQKFGDDRYFAPRPSATDFATVPSGASNLGPTSADWRKLVAERETRIREANHLAPEAAVPRDLLFASGSGLDPHISPDAARVQIARVAHARHIDEGRVAALVERFVEPPQLAVLGEPRVNVLALNCALDDLR